MSIKRIIFLFLAIVVSFAAGLGFWMMRTDVVLSPESVDNADKSGNIADKDAIVENGNENISNASPYVETLPGNSGIEIDSGNAKNVPAE